MKNRICFVLMLSLCLPAALAADAPAGAGQHAETFQNGSVKLDYLLYLPQDYGKDVSKKWPLIFFLHGSGECGSDVNRVKVHGPPKLVGQKDSPLADRFIVVSPQCPDDRRWNPDELNPMLDDVLARYRIDPDRVYLTGLSMGGFGTWAWAERNPDRFAAIAPMCGGGDLDQADQLKDLPIWVFHGEKDPTVSIRLSEEMVDAVEKAGDKQMKFTRYPDAGHDCWTRSYNNPQLYAWFLEHKRAKRVSSTQPVNK